tara:strand:- start:599 stop:1366 length:768 start_codon:yes stop_codon:yes gene_type:complete
MAQTAGEKFIESMSASATAPATMTDYQTEADRLSFLLPPTRKQNIYDLASDLSTGLAAQAASGQPASIGYGLAGGFNLFSKNAEALRTQADAVKQSLMKTAYASVEKRRAETEELRIKGADYDFKIALEEMKKTGEFLAGTNNIAGSWNYILSKVDPNTNQYKMVPDGKGGTVQYDPSTDAFYGVAKGILQEPKTETRLVPGQGQVSIQTPGFDVDGTLNLQGAPQAAIDFLKANNTPENREYFKEKYGSLPGEM